MNTGLSLRFAALVLLVASCGGGSETATLPRSDLPESFHLAQPPAGAKTVTEALASAKDGDAVVVTGRVGGYEKPFVDGTAAFTIVDPKLVPCVEDGMDCETPWDYCCHDPKEIGANSAIVELVDNGAAVKASPRGFHGLDHLKTVTVAGTAKKDAQGHLTVLAKGVYVKP